MPDPVSIAAIAAKTAAAAEVVGKIGTVAAGAGEITTATALAEGTTLTAAAELAAASEVLTAVEGLTGTTAIGGTTEALSAALGIEPGSIGADVLSRAEISGRILARELGSYAAELGIPEVRTGAAEVSSPVASGERYAVDGAGNKLTREEVEKRVTPSSVEPVNGRYPINARFAGLTVPLEWFPGVPEHLRDGTIRFTEGGFPDFSSWRKELGDSTPADVKIELSGDRLKDEQLANQACQLDQTPEGYTWHHHQDTGRMQLVNSDVHAAVRHTGGYSIHKAKVS